MSRRRRVVKRDILPDPLFGDTLVTRCINVIMKQGKKSTAERMFYGALDTVKEKTTKDPMPIFKKAVSNVKPSLEVKSRRVGGATYQVPVEVRPGRQVALALRWIVTNARKRGERDFKAKLAGEIMDAANNAGSAVKKKEDTHKMAEANKAFSHYRW
ncbi:MAG: 30S ribosomal protein S7 [Nitrospinota bacterium]|nr:30S ribosomal protein S7 [Nitrospinota bacterium]